MTESKLRTAELCLARTALVLTVLLWNAAVTWAQLPAPWDNQDVGSVGVAGSASHASGVFTVQGSGANVWGTADGFHFVYRPMTGDGQIVARVDSVTKTDSWAKAGVMMRDGLEGGDANAFAFVSAGGNVRFQRRRTPGATTASLYTAAATLPHWVKLVRTGDTLAAYFSSDGTSWTSAGTNTFVMNSTIYVGLAVTSHNQSVLSTAKFRNVSVTSSAGNSPPVVSLTAPADGAQFDAPATINLGASASDSDGTIQQVQFFSGSTLLGTDTTSPYTTTVSNVAEGTYSLKAVALDNQGATASSTASVTVRPGSLPWLNEDIGNYTVAGSATFSLNSVTVRGEGTDIWNTTDGFHFVYQTLAGDGEIVARVDSLQEIRSWTNVGVMMREALTGSSSHAYAFQAASTGVGFTRRVVPGGESTFTGGSGASAPRWLRIVRQGSTFTASESATGTTWTVVGSQTITMPSTIYVGLAVTSASAGSVTTATFSNITVRSTTPPSNQPPSVTITAPGSGANFTAPATIAISASASDPGGSVTQVQFFAGSTLLATDTTSPYAYSWTNVAAGSYSLTAVARDNQGATRTSAAVPVTVTSTTNQPPSVSITTPVSGATLTAPATIAIAANASDPGGSVSQVQFFAGSTLLGTDTSSPYTYSWTNVPAGAYSLTAVARDNQGATRTSVAVAVTVTAAGGPPPQVVFNPSPDHAVVMHYLLEIFRQGDTPGTSTPIATRNLGKPAVVNNEISVDIATLITPLAPGNYIATVSAVNANGSCRSAPPSAFVR
jgi:regulation of enolase protein 1 (concanavalin A-like superfamily)